MMSVRDYVAALDPAIAALLDDAAELRRCTACNRAHDVSSTDQIGTSRPSRPVLGVRGVGPRQGGIQNGGVRVGTIEDRSHKSNLSHGRGGRGAPARFDEDGKSVVPRR